MRTLSVGLAVLLSVGAANLANGQGRFAERVQDLDLTDQQEAKIADIQKASRPKVQEAAKALGALVKEEVEKIQEVLNAEQRQKVQALREDRDERQDRREECLSHALANLKELDLTDAEMSKIGEIRGDIRPQMAKAVKELEGLLIRRPEEGPRGSPGFRQEPQRSPSSPQAHGRAKGKSGLPSARTCAPSSGRSWSKSGTCLRAGQAEKVQDLREERSERVRDRRAHRIANLKDLNLTEEQRTKIASIREEYRPKIQEAGNKLRRGAGRGGTACGCRQGMMRLEGIEKIIGLRSHQADIASVSAWCVSWGERPA